MMLSEYIQERCIKPRYWGLNPCFSGWCSLRPTCFLAGCKILKVLILVLVDDALWVIMFCLGMFFLLLVLILVLVDDALWETIKIVQVSNYIVLILVLVDDALWVQSIITVGTVIRVLILVLVDDALWGNTHKSKWLE